MAPKIRDGQEKSIGIPFVLIPPGEFDMGSTEAEVAKLLEEAKASNQQGAYTRWYIETLTSDAPKHRVRITKPFYLSASELTQAQDELVMGSNPSKFKENANCPVEMITWDDASAFCRELGELPEERSGEREYRLPTEAEWEYACRAGTTRTWYSGDDEAGLKEIAWYAANAGGKTHPVCEKTPNAWGLYDMHGNVWEWCEDWWAADYYEASPLEDPTGPAGGPGRVNRGDCGWCRASDCRASHRSRNVPGRRHWDHGFRIARIVSIPETRTAVPQKGRDDSLQHKAVPPPKPSPPATTPPAAKPGTAAIKPTGAASPLAVAQAKNKNMRIPCFLASANAYNLFCPAPIPGRRCHAA